MVLGAHSTLPIFANFRALIKKCNNALYPDLYGHYREAKFTQTKHHWWWKANRVFNQLEITRNHTGLVVFLEEDHYVAEDFIYILKLMERTCKESCKHCNILSLGTYLKTFNYYGDAKKKEALRAIKQQSIISAGQVHPSWTFQVLPSLYQHSQKVASLAFMSLYVFHCELHQIRTRLRQHFDVTRISSVAFIHNQHDSITRIFL
jgi:hypothetical protein